ncbi:CheY-like chemotaxis protein [Rhodopseudomonas thermotolerans]|jgi:CheY-like chemotaxis protein|uniref:CheY-like chemotaxis protein n=2 Tax=Rhodopseudomonas TaxID=1073 RepID=A0A336JYR0_9BRAD|nr:MULTISPECIES: response regulator [Rhodopseudomonas]RED34492.1 CheY-like chemotaxis protein [Rhodopseudomonas pentothenatexigens]REG02688.1 CheY-like chemotaxis protein [Rhodopseudomonas thermotolerans]SSW91161.1 CheY-like chemotaxis protein [Rhodopseudomonas pentothenatexigens]
MIAHNPGVTGRRVLLVEDEYFIADDMVRVFEELGAEVVGPFSRIEDALAAVSAADRLDAAVLDVNLQGTMVFPLADELTARGIRFVFATGYDHHAIPARFDHVVRCEKPADPEAVITALFGA